MEKEQRIIGQNSWLSELIKEAKTNVNVEITKITVDPNNTEQVCMSGKGHFRLWRCQSGILKPNTPFDNLDQTRNFTDHAWLDGGWLIGATDKGELLFIYDNKQCIMEAPAFAEVIDSVSCILPFYKGFFVGGATGQLSVWEKKPSEGKEISEEKLKDMIHFDKNISNLLLNNNK